MDDPGDTREIGRKVTLHRVEIPVAMKDAAVIAADVAMNTYNIEKAHFLFNSRFTEFL